MISKKKVRYRSKRPQGAKRRLRIEDITKPFGLTSKKRRKPKVPYSPEKFAEVCKLISEGWSLARICRMKDMPGHDAVYSWINKDTENTELWSRANEQRQWSMVEDMLTIADGATPDDVHVARLRVDTRKWLLSKLGHKRFGDNLGDQLAGGRFVISWQGENQEPVDITPKPLALEHNE